MLCTHSPSWLLTMLSCIANALFIPSNACEVGAALLAHDLLKNDMTVVDATDSRERNDPSGTARATSGKVGGLSVGLIRLIS